MLYSPIVLKRKGAEKVVLEIKQVDRKAVALSFDASNSKALDGFVESVKSAVINNWGTDTFDYLINNAATGATIPIA